MFAGTGEQVLGAKDVVLDGLGGTDLHQRDVLVGGSMEHHRRVVRLKYLVQTGLVPDGADQHRDRHITAILLLQFHQQFIGTVLINIEDKQFCRFEAHDLTAELAADAAAAARHQNGLAGEVAGDFLRVQRDFLTGEEIGGVQLTERTLLRGACTHQLGVAEHLHGAMGGDAEVDDVVQAASLQGRDRHDDGVDVVAGTQVGNFFQCAAHRDTVDGLAQLVGVIIHGYDDMAVAGIGLADIDGPRTSFARTHDHDRAVGVLAGVAA